MEPLTPDLMRKMGGFAGALARHNADAQAAFDRMDDALAKLAAPILAPPEPDAVFHPPLGEPVHAPVRTATCAAPTDEFDHASLTLTESRIARENLAELVETLRIKGLRFSRGTYKLTVAPGGQPFVIERATLGQCINAAHELNLSLVTSQPQEAA